MTSPSNPGTSHDLLAGKPGMAERIRARLASRGGAVLPLSAILLSAFALRVWLLDDQNVWWDEVLAIWAVRQDWLRMTLWTAADVHPPVYFWLLKAWVSLAGEAELAARFISLICGMVTVAALYPLSRILLGRRVALLATCLLAFSRFHVWWSQEMRMYIVATMWGVLSLYLLLRWCMAENWYSVPRSWRGWWPSGMGARPQHPARLALLYVLATTAGLYTLYLFVTIVLIENLFFLYLLLHPSPPKRKRALVRWILAQVAVLMLSAPWLAVALPRMRSWCVAEPFSLRIFVRLYATLLTLGISTYVERYVALVAPFFAIVVAAIGMLWWPAVRRLRGAPTAAGSQPPTPDEARQARSISLLLGLYPLVPTLVVYVLTRPRGLFYSPRVEARYLVLFAPTFYLLLAWSLDLLYRRVRWVGLVALILVAAVFAWTLPGHYAGRYLRDEHQTMARVIAAYAEPGDAVVLVSGNRYPIFGYYYERLPEGSAHQPVYAVPRYTLQVTADNVERELAPLVASHTRLWLAQINAPMEDPQGLVKSWLDQHLVSTLSYGFVHNALTLYAPAGDTATVQPGNLAPQYGLSGTAGAASLLGYDLPTLEFREGDVVRLGLYYATSREAQAALRWVDARGRILEQRLVTLPAAEGIGREQLEFAVYSHTPVGLYHFELEDPGQPGQVISFGSLRVTRTRALPAAGTPSVALSAKLEDGIEMVGYTLSDEQGRPVRALRAGQRLNLDLHWIARTKPTQNYTVFAHLIGSAYNPATAGPVWAGHDREPLERGYPTQQWLVDQVVVDRHVLTADAGAPAGEYKREAGMYLLQTMQRLLVTNGQGQSADRIVLGRFQVVQP